MTRPGFVPTAPVRQVIHRLLNQSGHKEDGIEYVARRCNLYADSVDKALKKPEIDFDLADLILCRLGVAFAWQGELKAIYEAVEFQEEILRCKNPRCFNGVPPNLRAYCSKGCRKAADNDRYRNRVAA